MFMKKILLLLSFVAFLSTLCISQTFIDEEVESLATKIATRMDAKNGVLPRKKQFAKIVVEKFTDTEGNVSKLGANLTEEFSLALANVGLTFVIVTGDAQNPDLGDVGDAIEKGGEGVGKSTDNSDVQKKTEGVSDIIDGIGFFRSKKKYKGVDAIVKGIFTESNDQYRLNIKVVSNGSDGQLIASDKGYISKTPFIRSLEEEQLKRQQFVQSGTSAGKQVSYGQSVGTFSFNYLNFELHGCTQKSQSIQCDLTVVNTGTDMNSYVYANKYSRVIDAKNGHDYWATRVKFGELVHNSQVKKTLITNTPVSISVTFGGAAGPVEKLSKLEIRCWEDTSGTFNIEMRDIQVQH